ncbi:MAG: PAS domain S-box protein [Isosphaeraceae bacterium]
MRNQRTSLWWYPIVLAATGAALLFDLALGGLIWPNVYLPFMIVVLVCSRYGGLGPGLASTILALEACIALLASDPGMTMTPRGIAIRATFFTGFELLVVFLMVASSKADKALRESEANFRATFELAGVGKSQADPATGRLLRVNRKMCEITGYSASELLERTFLDITHPDDRAQGWVNFRRMASGEAPDFDAEKRYVRKDGTIVWVHVNSILIRDDNGNPLRAVAIIENITKRKRAEEQLRTTLESIGDAFIACDSHWRFVYINAPAERLLRYRREEILGKTLWEVYHLSAGTRLQEEYERAAAGESRDFEYYHEPWDRWFHHRCFPREGGGISAYFQDVTERKRVEEANRESQRRFRAMADTVPCLVWVTQDKGSLTFWNDRWYETTGGTPDNSLGWGWVDFIHPEDRGRAVDAWQTCVREGTVLEIETRFRCADSGYRWFLSRGVPRRDDAGNIVEWFGTCTDIDAQKQTQAALVEATQAKDRFLAVLSHELRTPLTPVLLAVTAMQENVAACSLCMPGLEIIRSNIELEARLIDDLLDISRIARGKMTYRFETVDVHALIRRAMKSYSSDLSLKGHQLSLELTAAEYHVHGDPARLQQVLCNLLTNAVKYTPAGGHITVRTRSGIPGRLKIEVIDDGIGVRPEDLAHLFDPFERGYGATALHESGLGLGLAICRSIAEAHHGSLRCSSEGLYKGSTLTLELATVLAPLNGAEPKRPHLSVGGRRLRILVAEDNSASASVIADVLRGRGHVVTLATSLHQALEAATSDIDLLVSDLDLGDGSGLELMRHVRSLGEIPGIALSGYATADDVRESLEAGFATHLAKPVTLSALESAITELTVERRTQQWASGSG